MQYDRLVRQTLTDLEQIGALVDLQSSHDCQRGCWGWTCEVSGPRPEHLHGGPEEDPEPEDLGPMSVDDSTMIRVSVWSRDPETALTRSAASYRAAYAEVIVEAGG